jgi:hypothetical protein
MALKSINRIFAEPSLFIAGKFNECSAMRSPVGNRSALSFLFFAREMRTINGRNKVRAGLTRIEQVLRVTQTKENLAALVEDRKSEVWGEA